MNRDIDKALDCPDIAFVAEEIAPEYTLPEGCEMTDEARATCMSCLNHPD